MYNKYYLQIRVQITVLLYEMSQFAFCYFKHFYNFLFYVPKLHDTHISKHEIKTSGLRDVPLCSLVNIHVFKDRSRLRTSRSICAKIQRNCMEEVNSQCVCFFQGFPRHTAHSGMQVFCTHLYEGWNFNSGNYLFTTDTK